MLDFRVDTFLMVCETMNYTKAAQMLNITQPAVSQHIHFLEQYYGTKLFQMKGKKLSLTKQGELLRASFLARRQDDSYIKEQLESSKTGKKQLRFGVTLTIGEYVIGDAVCRYYKNNPNGDIRIRIGNTMELTEELDHGKIDFALVEGIFDRQEYDAQLYSREPYIAVSGEKREPTTLQALFQDTLIIREEGSGTRNILEKNLELNNAAVSHFRNRIEINNISLIKRLTMEKCGITFLYKRAVEAELQKGLLFEIPLLDLNIQHDFTYIWRKGSIFGDAYREIIKEFMRPSSV